jgi:Uma2 family endonuclease
MVAIVPFGDYSTDHPSAALLIVEVAHTSHRKDREVKAPLYAACGVPEYWLVDVPARTVEVHTEPSEGLYTHVELRTAGDAIALVAFPDVAIAVGDLL